MATVRRWMQIVIVGNLASMLLIGCEQTDKPLVTPKFTENKVDAAKLYTFSVHPLHNPTRLHEIFGPVIDYLTKNIPGAKFQLEASRNYAAYDERLYSRKPDFSLPNPFQTINAIEHGYRVFGKMELSRFESATNAVYQPVRDFVDVFNKTVRPVK